MRLFWLCLSFLACRQDMHDQPKYEPMEASAFFGDGRSVRPQVPGTIARGELQEDAHLYTGMVRGQPAETFPFEMTAKDLKRGRERYDIYCSPCHGEVGDGLGMVVKRGFPKPPSLHDARIVHMPVGHYVDVITRGLGRMYPYSTRVKPHDRWRIGGYIRALQRARSASLADVPPDVRSQLESHP